MWWWTVLVLQLLAIDISSQLDNNATEPPVRCCPCPDERSAPAAAQPVDVGLRSAPRSPDVDCPCARDADGAASMFFPQVVRAFGNTLKPEPKEDPKPLLHPEVDLASSVLETLREVTDEEYRDALERDAARAAAADVVHLDREAAEAGNVVTIIVSPQDMGSTGADDILSEASHVQETRCIHPSLGSTRDSYQNGIEEILNLPTGRHRLDNNLAASDVHESVVKPENNLNRLLSGLKLRSNPGFFRLNKNKFTPDAIDSNQILNEDKNLENRDHIADVDCEKQSITREEAFETNEPDLDSDPSPNNVQEEFIETSATQDSAGRNEINFPNSKFPQFSQINKEPSQKPFPIKNLFKLKDVELIPLDLNKKIPKSKLNIPDLKFDIFDNKARAHSFDPVKIPKLIDLFGKPSTEPKQNVEVEDTENHDIVDDENMGNIKAIGKRKEFSTEILDAIPSPTAINARNECMNSELHSDKSSNNEFENVDDLLDSDTKEDTESHTEIESDSIRNDVDFTNMSDLESVENIESSINEINQNNDPTISENLEQNSDTELLVISSEEINDVPPSAIDLSELSKPEERSQEVTDKNHPAKTLEEIRRSVVAKLDALQLNNRNALNNIKQNMEEISETTELNSKETNAQGSEEEIPKLNENSEPCLPTSHVDDLKEASAEEISFADLQNMSDSILEASEKSEHCVTAMNVEQEDSEEVTANGKIDSSRTDYTKPAQESEKTIENKEKNLCPSDLVKSSPKEDSNSVSGSKNNELADSDLEPLASEPIVHSIFRPNSKSLAEHLSDIESKLRQNIIVQPASLINPDHLNIFRTPALSIPDISELNTNIPTLGEIRARVSEILSGLARQAEDDDFSSEMDSDEFSSNTRPVLSTGASSSNPVSILSPLQPLKDINLDIVQLKPIPLISGTNPLKAAFPGLNLNTYKARLAVPKTLDLKPLNLASTLGTDGGLLGARLSIEPEKKDKISKNRWKTKNADISSDRLLGITKGGIGSTLADVTATVQNNARNLLNFPKSVGQQTLQANNVLGNIAENIKSNAENSIRNIHQSINSPFDDSRVHSIAPSSKIFSSSRNTLSTAQSNVHNVVDNLKAQTENTFRNIQQSLSTPSLNDFNDSVHKAGKNILKSSAPVKGRFEETLDSAVNNLLSQTEAAMKSIQQTNLPPLSEISNSIQNSAKNALKSSKTIIGTNNLKSTLQPSLPLEKVVDSFRSQTQNTMRKIHNPLNAPIFPDISTTVHKHAQDLLKSSNTLGNMLQVSAPIDLKPHAEKAVKDIQKTLKATLKNSPINDLQKLSHPEDIIQMITNHQEDVNDKLLAIHTDLNDRLESLHNEVMDTERLKSILSPPNNRPFDLFAIPLPSSRMSYPIAHKQASAALKTKEPSGGRKFKETLKPASKASVPRPKPGATMRASTGKGRDAKTFKMSKAASAPVTAQTNKPVSLISKKPTLTKSVDKDSTKKPFLSRPDTAKSLHGIKRPLLSKHKPLVENKIKVTFASTTYKPPRTQKPVSSTAKPKVSGNRRFKPKPVRQPTPWPEARSASKPSHKGDPISSSSRIVPKLRPHLKHNAESPVNKEKGSRLESASKLKPQRLPKLKPQPIMKLTPGSQGRASDLESKLRSSPLLTKLSEALKNKHTKSNLRLSDLDAATAPSEHVEKVVALEQPMKENVSYKCKMMCVKLD